jgi:hypothetical protein
MAQVNSLNLLKKATNPPVAYQGKIVVTTWHSKASDAAMLWEWRLPDGRYRVEYLAPRNLRGVVLLSDGKRRWRLVNNRPVWQLPLDDAPLLQVDLLARNYRLSAPRPRHFVGSESMAGGCDAESCRQAPPSLLAGCRTWHLAADGNFPP